MSGRSGQPYVALLRAINLGNHNRIAMNDLRALFEALPAEDVATYLQSGNVVFRSRIGDSRSVAGAARQRISAFLGLDIEVFVRGADELARVVAENPFLAMRREEAKLHVTFLDGAPEGSRVANLASASDLTSGDEFQVIGRQVYLHCPGGYGSTKLTNGFFERKLGVTATTRNWRSVTTLADMAEKLTTAR